MKKINRRVLLISTIGCLLPIIVGLILYDKLPAMLPTHFNSAGEVDSYSSKNFTVFGLPLLLAAINLITIIFVNIDPKRKLNQDNIINLIYWIIPVLTNIVCYASYFVALGYAINVTIIVEVFTGLLIMVIGNYLPKIKPNYTVGIKLPWTLNDDDNWYKTHRYSGKVWFVGGFLLILSSFIPSAYQMFFFIIIISILVIIPFIYSYRLYLKKNHNS